MCENCAELVEVLNEISDADSSDGVFQLKKEHALRVLGYISSWTQRQCLCCFKEYKHLEVFNQLVYALINLVIAQISSLRDRLCSLHSHHHHHHHAHKVGGGGEGPSASGWSDGVPRPLPQPSSPGEDEPVNVERDSAEEDGDSRTDLNQNKMQGQPGPAGPRAAPAAPTRLVPGAQRRGRSCCCVLRRSSRSSSRSTPPTNTTHTPPSRTYRLTRATSWAPSAT